jgi:uncharacterized membrane protein
LSKYVVVVFPNETKAYEGFGAFNALHTEHSLTLYGIAVIVKDADGNASVKESDDEGPLGTALGMLTGGLIGALAGPAGMLVGATGGGLLGSLGDLDNVGVGLDFLEMVGNKMDAGTAAVVTEVDEYWSAPLDTRMEALGGEVHRRTRADFEDEQFAQEVQAWNDEMDELDAEMQESSDEIKAKLKAKKETLGKKISDAMEKGGQKIIQLENEEQAKVAKMEKQAADAKTDAKAKIEKRIAQVKANHKARMEKIKKAMS